MFTITFAEKRVTDNATTILFSHFILRWPRVTCLVLLNSEFDALAYTLRQEA